mgnify:CR=1 FL=1|jgi:hypothetical protein
MRIAMWSGPRNLSTAMMYAFAQRSDFAVMDEPFYAPYLAKTGSDHPMAAEIIGVHACDPTQVAQACLGPIPGDKPHLYMKHMPHHMIPGFPLEWAAHCTNVHLLRHPARVIASYGEKRAEMTLEDLGYPQQSALFDRIGGTVIDSADIRDDPAAMLGKLCAALRLEFDPAMLSWPTGGRPEDGVWASHWYGAIHASTGFSGPEGPLPELTPPLARLCDAAMPYYEALAAHRIRPHPSSH